VSTHLEARDHLLRLKGALLTFELLIADAVTALDVPAPMGSPIIAKGLKGWHFILAKLAAFIDANIAKGEVSHE
jgi:hypothetical protein